MSKHTPGPWTVIEGDGDEAFEVKGPTQTDGFRGGYRWFNEADALVIAAAPDMLDALKAFMAKWAIVLPHINSAFVMQHIHGANYAGPTLACELEQMEAAIAKAEGL